MERRVFENSGVNLSYLDAGGDGKPIIALHAYWMEAGTYADTASALSPEWRVLALDQRGHGRSDKPDDLSWDAFIDDLEAFLDHLEIHQPVVLMGNSLGGTVAFQFAARTPHRVQALIIEEAPAVEDSDLEFMRAWAGVFPTREALLETVGERMAWSIEPSIRKTEAGWTLAFSPTKLADAQVGLNGDFWADWLATTCPALLLRGRDSRAVDGEVLEAMAARRPNTRLETLPAGHVVHHDAPQAFVDVVRQFLMSSRA